ncbi:MAG: putative membrane protein affecting hemolysin expression [Candidatus Azotimanducaceae bacterium]|jgi:uncharacterized membrane protein affecting hemolysin expression
MFRSSLVLVLLLMNSACTWVKVSERAAEVRVATLSEVLACQQVGKTTSISKASIAGLKRSTKKLATELETIAINQAPGLGGNTVVAIGDVTGDEQTFQIFQCPR